MQAQMSAYPLTLVHALERAERLFGDKTITTFTATDRTQVTYAEWADRTRRLAGALDDLGVSADGRVATFGWNTARHLELYFAAPCSGRIVHTLNVRLFAEQIRYIVEHARDEVIFVDRSLVATLWPIVADLDVRHVVVMDDGDGDVPDDPRVVDYEELIGGASPAAFRIDDENRAAALCYTSGTTGNPKGVLYSHRSSVLHALAIMLADTIAVSERDTILPVVPMFHANAWGLPHAAVMAGSSLVLPGPRTAPAAVADAMERERVTLAAAVPTVWTSALEALAGRDLSALRAIVCGGSAVPRALSEAYREQVGLPILQAWGMTETSPIASLGTVKSALAGGTEEDLADLRSAQGVVLPLVEARIVEPDTTELLPWDGQARGELQVVGPWIAASYYRNEGGTAAFTDDGWLRTGDVATISRQGYIRLIDRTKDLVKSGGEWISSVELENEIVAHPCVREAAVIAIPDERWGERPLACVVVAEGAELDADEIRRFLADRVAKWWIPERIEFIDEVPKTSVGKFSKQSLRARFAAPAGAPTS